MSKKQQTDQLTDQEVDLLREILDWWEMTRPSSETPIRFDHREFKITTVRLNKQLQEKAERYALISPQYKSFSNMVETLIWRETGSSTEFVKVGDVETEGNEHEKGN